MAPKEYRHERRIALQVAGLSAGADMFICECYQDVPGIPNHMDRQTLKANRARLTCKKLLLTHSGRRVNPQLDSEFAIWARDGMVIPI